MLLFLKFYRSQGGDMYYGINGVIERARQFAIEAHAGHTRGNRAQQPYCLHLFETAELIKEAGGSESEIVAGWLHDTVEDTKTTIEEIRGEFGEEIADIVSGLTDPKWPEGIPTLERKRNQAEHVKTASRSIRLCKLADQISNVRCVAIDPPVKWNAQKCRDYVHGAKLIADECQGLSSVLDSYFVKAYVKAVSSKWLA